MEDHRFSQAKGRTTDTATLERDSLALSEWLITAKVTDPDPPDFEQLLNRPTWMTRAACRGQGPSTFFLGPGFSARAARKVCDSCPVFDECLDFALSAEPELRGFWAGTSERQRRRLRLQAS